MKSLKKISLTVTLVTALLFNFTFAQDDAVKNQEKNQIKTKVQDQVQNKVKVQLNEQNQVHGKRFVDANNDGYNDIAPDADGDGIPNGKDEDYSGSKNRKGNSGHGFVDMDGDGINDNAIDSDGDGIPNGQDADYVRTQDGTGQQNRKGNMKKNNGKMWGPNDGTGNDGIGPKNGTGYGSGNGSGDCDGTGPKGSKRGRK